MTELLKLTSFIAQFISIKKITHELGVEAIQYWLNNFDKENTRIKNEFIIEGVKLILKNNTFTFENENYIQLKGTAMGTKFAPTYATLVLGYLEMKLYDILEANYGKDNADKIVKNYKRFLDDIFIIWNQKF